MYIYHVENVRAGRGGRLYLEIPQNGPFWPETQLNPPDQLPITFFWYESKLFKSVHNVQQLQGNKKELNNHDAMCSWGSEEQKNIKKSSRKWDFLPGVARSIPYNFCLMWPQTFSMFLICQTTLGEQKRTKQPWSNVFMGVRGPKKHQKKLPEMRFSPRVCSTNSQ